MSTYYEILNVASNAPSDEITTAYRSLAKILHPDLNGNDPDSTRNFQSLNDAYEVLSDPVRRSEYDVWINQKEMGWGEIESHGAQPNSPYYSSRAPHHTQARECPPVSQSAKWAMYLGVGSCLFLHPLGIGAILYWYKAKREIAESNGTLGGDGYATTGLILGCWALAIFLFTICLILAEFIS